MPQRHPKPRYFYPNYNSTCPEKLTKTLKLIIMSEIQLQAKIFQHYWNNHPSTRGLIFHVPNGGKRTKIESTQLKASGVVPGIPDLLVLNNGRCYGIELKTDIGRVRPEQIKIHEIWQSNNVPVYVIRTFEDAVSVIDSIITNTADQT